MRDIDMIGEAHGHIEGRPLVRGTGGTFRGLALLGVIAIPCISVHIVTSELRCPKSSQTLTEIRC